MDKVNADWSPRIEPGAPVEVRNRFEGRWSPGFEVIDERDVGVRVRRVSDGAELPGIIEFSDVRYRR